MAINERLIHTAADAAGGAEAEQGLILHLDANDVDSYDGDGSVWYDISEYDAPIPLSDNADDLELHLNASDSTSYGGGGTTWTDISGNSRNGTIDSTVAATFDKDNGGYFDFRGDNLNDQVSVSYNSALDLTSSGLTIELWCKPDSTGYEVIYNSTGSSQPYNGIQLFFHSGFDYYIYSGGVSRATKTSGGSTVSTSEWGHYVITIEGTASGSNVKTYINGELDYSNTLSAAYTGSIEDILLGNYTIISGNYDYDGKLGAVRIYSKELSASEVGQNYRHGRDYIYTDLILNLLFLHLDAASFDGSTNTPSTWTDSSGIGNNGTITGATFDSELGNWLSFDGSGDKVTIPNRSAFHSTNSFTYELWVKKNDTSEDILLKLGSHPTYYLSYNNGVGYWFNDYASGNGSTTRREARTGSVSDTIGKWTHICLVHNPILAPKIYINGEYMSVLGRSATGGTSGTKDLILGEQYTTAAWYDWNGDIGQVRFYSKTLTADEIMQNYNFTKNNYPNTNHGTITGASWNNAVGETDSPAYFTFNGSDVINTTLDLNSGYNSAGKGFTLTAWFRLALSPNALNALFGDSNIVFGIAGSNVSGSVATESMWLYQSSPYISTWGTSALAAYADEEWHHIAITAVGTSTSDKLYYVDGSLESQFHQAGQSENWSFTDLRIGQSGLSSTYDFKGDIAEVKAFNRILTLDEIKTQFNLRCEEFGLTILP